MSIEFKQYKAKELCLPMLKTVLPLDDESLGQILDYAVVNLHNRLEAETHFVNLLGTSPDALKFINAFLVLIYGLTDDEQLGLKVPKSSAKSKSVKVASLPQSKIAAKMARLAQTETQNRSRSPLSPNSTGITTSQLIDQPTESTQQTQAAKKAKKKTLNNLKDIESALTELEVANSSEISSTAKRYCNCMGTRHPLFEMFPNCLNCGKIICVKEGIQPCSFCGKELLSSSDFAEIQQILEREKEELEGKPKVSTIVQPKAKKREKITVSLNSTGTNNFKEQERFFHKVERKLEQDRAKEAEEALQLQETKKIQQQIEKYESTKDKDPELLKAQERLDNLLNFQENGVERTKIIDQAADFETPNSASSLWASPVERAIQLRKQQKQLRKQEEQERARNGKGRHVVDVVVKNGKVFLHEKAPTSQETETTEEDKDINKLQEELTQVKIKEDKERFSNIWDYKQDKYRWQKPMYLSAPSDTKTESSLLEAPLLVNADLKKVQFGNENDIEDNLFRLPGI